jgi:hypothetical protein
VGEDDLRAIELERGMVSAEAQAKECRSSPRPLPAQAA